MAVPCRLDAIMHMTWNGCRPPGGVAAAVETLVASAVSEKLGTQTVKCDVVTMVTTVTLLRLSRCTARPRYDGRDRLMPCFNQAARGPTEPTHSRLHLRLTEHGSEINALRKISFVVSPPILIGWLVG